ncbi:MAG TPA: YceI family protein [Thermoanaerobaculia bacterium]|jgi:polyisoprenoid-binding protein YceI|nr:YceI family protein [Thermoanaerobaculia bacterium]
MQLQSFLRSFGKVAVVTVLVAGVPVVASYAQGAAAPAAPAPAGARIYGIDRSHSHLGFSIRHLLTRVDGRFKDFAGAVVYDPKAPEKSSVEVTAQATSIDTDTPNRDNDLRSENFFDVAKFPTLSFKSTSVKAVSPTKLDVTGDFTMHGVTKRITVPVEVMGTLPFRGGEKAGFATTFTLDRKDYSITWNRALDTGSALLGDEVTINIQLETGWEPPKPAETPKPSGR